MRYPRQLRPQTHEDLTFPGGRTVQVPKAVTTFRPWKKHRPRDTYGRKAVLNLRGKAAFAELAIRLLFEQAGWDGVWVDSFRGKFRKAYWKGKVEVELPPKQKALFDRIVKKAGRRGGCWDVLCWKGRKTVFAEAKRRGKDRIRGSQKRWLQAALAEGLTANNFLVVEWSLENR